MYETANILQWPLEVIQAVNKSLDLGIEEERLNATDRENLIRDIEDPSQNLLDMWVADIELSKTRLEALMEAKAAIVGALRIVEKDLKCVSN